MIQSQDLMIKSYDLMIQSYDSMIQSRILTSKFRNSLFHL